MAGRTATWMAAVVTGVGLVLGGVAAQAGEDTRPGQAGDGETHRSPTGGQPMHAEMMSSSPDMARMHAEMMGRHGEHGHSHGE